MQSWIRKIVFTGAYAALPFCVCGGRYEEEAGILPGSDAWACYYAYTEGKDATSAEDPWLWVIAKNYDFYASMSGEQLITERRVTSPDTYEHRIIDWILVYRKYYTYDQVRQLSGETEIDASDPYASGRYYAQPQQHSYYPHPTQLQGAYQASHPGYGRAPYGYPVVAPSPQPNVPQQQSVASTQTTGTSSKKGAETLSSKEPTEEDMPPTAPKIEIFDKNTIQISLGGEIIGKYTYDNGLWNNEVENTTYLHKRPLEANHENISFELGGINFKVHLNGDIEVFGSTPIMRCVLECPSEGRLIIPEGKDLQINRFVCMTRGKIIENYGRIVVAEACFCFEQTIINHGEIITTLSQPGKPKGVLLLLQSELKSDGGVEDIRSIHLKDRSYPEYGCCCFYGFDRSLYPVCEYPNYPDLTKNPNVFATYNGGKQNFFYDKDRGRAVLLPFNGQSSRQDYALPFAGNAIGVFIGNGNHGAGDRPVANSKFHICDSDSGRILVKYSKTTQKGITGDSLNEMFPCRLTSSIKMYLCFDHGFMIFEGSTSYNYSVPALYFFKL